MTNNAVRKAVIQVALVVALVLAANAIKPFSLGNVAMHTLAAARSFSFVLPEAAVERIEHANYLAQAYGKSWLDGGGNNSTWTKENALRSGLLASNISAESFDEGETKDEKAEEPARKPTAPKRSSRHVKHDGHDDHDEVSECNTKSQEVARLPVLPPVTATFDSIAMVQPMRLPV